MWMFSFFINFNRPSLTDKSVNLLMSNAKKIYISNMRSSRDGETDLAEDKGIA